MSTITQGTWTTFDEEEYNTKPSLWELGTHYLGPIFLSAFEISENSFTITQYNANVKITKANAYKYLIRFENTD